MSKNTLRSSIRSIMYFAGGLSTFGSLANVYAQESPNNNGTVEEVIVMGVRQSLETAVEIKRNTTAIVDHISAEDILGFPALSLGESLQAIPGIQLNRDSERRNSEVSMRGFSGGYVLQTVGGLEFANPTRSQGSTAPNPFGVFESSVFAGITVYKSQQADIVEGGIAGVIDHKLPDAFAKIKAGGSISVGGRYEQLSDSIDPELTLAGNMFLIEDKLAVAGKFAYSGQHFREDYLNTPNWVDLGSRFSTPDAIQFPTYQDWRDANGIYTDAVDPASLSDIVIFPDAVRQITEYSDGKRYSFTGNIAFQATEELKLDVDILGTRRNLDENEYQNLIVSVNAGNARITPLADPIKVLSAGDIDDDGNAVTQGHWFIPSANYVNSGVEMGNRSFDFIEQSRGVFFGAEWERDALKIESNLGLSRASNDFVQVYLRQVFGSGAANANNGVNGMLSINGTDGDAFTFTLENPAQFRFLGNGYSYATYDPNTVTLPNGDTANYSTYSNTGVLAPNALKGVGLVNANTTYNGVRPQFGLASNSQSVDRDLVTFDLSGTYQVDMPVIKAVKTGIRFSNDDLVSTFLNHTLEDTALDLLSDDLYKIPESGQSTGYFNGNLPNAVPAASGDIYSGGWIALDVNKTIATLQQRGIPLEPGQQYTAAGFIANVGNAGQASQNLDATLQTGAVFVMAELDQDLGFANLTGNVGVRHVDTELSADGFDLNTGTGNNSPSRNVNALPKIKVINRYSHNLPSINLNFEIAEDYIVRFASSRGLTRPNLKGVTPSTQIRYFSDTGDGSVGGRDNYVNVTLPDANVLPFTADSVDLTFEWYNRPGSNIALGLFHKKFKGQFRTLSLCPESYSFPRGGTTYDLDLQLTADGTCEITNPFTETFTGATGAQEINELRLRQDVNSDEVEVYVGTEISATQNLDFLPAPFDGLGFNASYTVLDNRDDADAFNVSDKSYNVKAYWENEMVSVTLSTNYRSQYRLNGGSASVTGVQERLVKSRTQYDLTVGLSPMEDVRISLQAFNLTDEQLEEHDYRSEQILRRLRYPGRTYALKASYSF